MRLLRGIALAVLVVLVGGGWFGGLSFLTDPSGGGMGMTTAELPDWPLLGDYTLPGVALVVLFGLLLTALGSAGLRLSEGARRP